MYGREKYERLVTIKNKYDPMNFFKLNQNIKPSVLTGILKRRSQS